MASVITLYIVRHGKTLLNTLDRVQGWCDSPLTPQGIEVAKQLGAGLQDIHIHAAYTSDLRRTRETAQTILNTKGQADLPITEMFGFREACFGKYESDFNHRMWTDVSLYLQYTSAEEMFKNLFNGNITNGDALDVIAKLDSMNMAENFSTIEKRTQEALTTVTQKEATEGKNKNILIVSHGMSIIAMLLNIGGKELLKTHLDNASVCKVTYTDGQFHVHTMGDMSYVEKGKNKTK